MDIVITIEPQIVDADLIVKNLEDEAMVIIAAPDANLEFLLTNSEGETARESIIFSEKGCSFRIAFENYLKQKKIKYANPLEFSSIEAIKKCVMNGLGISFLPLYAVRDELEEGSLKMIDVTEAFAGFRTQMAYHKNKSMSLPMSKLIELVLREFCDTITI